MTREETMEASGFQQVVDAVHPVMDVVSVLYIVVAAWFGMQVKNVLLKVSNEQKDAKADLIANQTAIKEELTAHNAKTRGDLQAHLAEDHVQFESIRDGQKVLKEDLVDRLERIEHKIDNGRTR